jgi:hypothetical protein
MHQQGGGKGLECLCKTDAIGKKAKNEGAKSAEGIHVEADKERVNNNLLLLGRLIFGQATLFLR